MLNDIAYQVIRMPREALGIVDMTTKQCVCEKKAYLAKNYNIVQGTFFLICV